MDSIKTAMRAKDTVALEALRAVKSELLLAQTSGSAEELSEEDEIKILQKLVKQRKDSATIFSEQNRNDLAEPELAQMAVIEQFLPAQLTEVEVEAAVAKIINDASGEFTDIVTIKGGMLGTQKLTKAEVVALAKLPSRDQMLGTLLATFNAPVSAFARVLFAIQEQKQGGAAPAAATENA